MLRCNIEPASRESDGLRSTIRTLADGQLPGAADRETTTPPSPKRFWFRQVRGFPLYLLFSFSADDLVLVAAVRREPPVYAPPTGADEDSVSNDVD